MSVWRPDGKAFSGVGPTNSWADGRGERHLGVGIDEGPLIDPPHPLERTDIEGVLGAAIARAFAARHGFRPGDRRT